MLKTRLFKLPVSPADSDEPTTNCRKSLNTESAAMLLEVMKDLASVLGLLETESVPRQEFLQLVNLLTSLRNELRAKREYALSDRIREQMQKTGVTVEDEAQ